MQAHGTYRRMWKPSGSFIHSYITLNCNWILLIPEVLKEAFCLKYSPELSLICWNRRWHLLTLSKEMLIHRAASPQTQHYGYGWCIVGTVGSMYLDEYGCRKCTNSQENNGAVRLSKILMTCILNEDRCILATHLPSTQAIYYFIATSPVFWMKPAIISTSVSPLTNNFQIAWRKQN